MKKIYLSALSILFGAALNAQTINQANHAPVAGDQFGMYQIDSLTVSTGSTGAGLTWNFNSMVTHSSTAKNYTAAVANTTAYPAASVVVQSGANNQAYYTSTATEHKYWGGNINFAGYNCQLTFTSPAVYMAYPTSLNSGTQSPVAGSFVVLGNSGTFTGVCTSTCTATGTMTLPGKVYNDVIRVTTDMAMNFTVQIPGTATQRTYDFYSLSNSKYPILSIVQSTITGAGNSSQVYAFVQKNYQNVGVKENLKDASAYSVYPNPASNQLNISTDNANGKSVAIFDITGKQVETLLLNNGKLTVDVSNYNNGIYIYKINDQFNSTVHTGKITVSH